MKQVTSLKELETEINENGEMIITKNNKNKVIVMSIEEYKRKLQEKKIEESLLKSEDDIENGRVRNAEDVFKEWEIKYGI